MENPEHKMKLGELLKTDTIAQFRDHTQVTEMEFKDYVPTPKELDDEIAQAKRSAALYKSQGKAPMVTKMLDRVKQLEAKKAKNSS